MIQARRQVTDNDEESLEVIPNSTFAGDLPFPLANHYVHWLNLRTEVVEFRLLSNAWDASDENLFLHCMSQELTRGRQSRVRVIDFHSSVFKATSARLEPLENAKHLVLTYDHASVSKPLRADLHRFQLSFFLNKDWQLESENTRGYVVDDLQAAGTLFGLHNQLILRKKHPMATRTPDSRKLLIPFGKVIAERTEHHVAVRIDTTSLDFVEYHTYTVDDILGRLQVSSSGMTSWFYVIYLHAVTSHCLPDPLLKRTGTEEALLALKSARSFSFIEFSSDVFRRLGEIAVLTPQRSYYPRNLKTMQSTEWSSRLHPLAQHNAFATLASEILAYAKSLQTFHGCVKDEVKLPSSPQNLITRAGNRSLSYYCQDLSDLFEAGCRDSSYDHLIDNLQNQRGALRAAYRVTRLSQASLETIANSPSPLWDTIASWSSIISPCPSEDDHPIKIDTLSYHRIWLDDHLERRWLEIHNVCRAIEPTHVRWRYQAAFTFSSMVYAHPSTEQQSNIYLSFIAISAIPTSPRPPLSLLSDIYTLLDEFEPTKCTLRDRLGISRRSWEHTPAASLRQKRDELYAEFTMRRHRHWQSQTEAAFGSLIDHIINQWRQDHIPPPRGSVDDWIDVTSGIQRAKEYFLSCRRNEELRHYIESLGRVLSSGNRVLGTLSTANADADCIRLLENWQPVDQPNEPRLHPPSLPMLCRLFASRTLADLSIITTRQFGSQLQISAEAQVQTEPRTLDQLETLLTQLEARRHRSSAVCKKYVVDLRNSCEVLKEDRGFVSLLQYENKSAAECEALLTRIRDAIQPFTIHDRVLAEAGQWPSVYPRTLLQQLNIHAQQTTPLDSNWRRLLVHFAERLLEHQRSRRLLDHHINGRTDEFATEMENNHFDREEALRGPDWLLVQVCLHFSYTEHSLKMIRLKETSS